MRDPKLLFCRKNNWNQGKAGEGEKQAYDAAGPGAFFDAGRFASGIASACAARTAAASPVIAATISGIFSAGTRTQNASAASANSSRVAR